MENPFLVLPINILASPSDILREVTLAMRAGRYDAKRVAGVQRILFNPLTRATAEFRYRLDTLSLIAELPSPEISEEASIPPLLDPFGT